MEWEPKLLVERLADGGRTRSLGPPGRSPFRRAVSWSGYRNTKACCRSFPDRDTATPWKLSQCLGPCTSTTGCALCMRQVCPLTKSPPSLDAAELRARATYFDEGSSAMHPSSDRGRKTSDEFNAIRSSPESYRAW